MFRILGVSLAVGVSATVLGLALGINPVTEQIGELMLLPRSWLPRSYWGGLHDFQVLLAGIKCHCIYDSVLSGPCCSPLAAGWPARVTLGRIPDITLNVASSDLP